MRSFLQKKADATYFSSSNVTANIRKHNLEFIFSLKNGWHAVVSVILTPEGVYVMSCLGSISEELDRIIPTLRLNPTNISYSPTSSKAVANTISSTLT